MTSQAREIATTAVHQMNEVRQRAAGLAEEYELDKKLAKVSEAVQPYQDKVTETIEPYRQQAVQHATETREHVEEKVAEGKEKARSLVMQILAKLYSFLVSAVAWFFTFVTKMVRQAPKMEAIEKPKAVVQKTTEKVCDLMQDKVPVKVAEKVEQVVSTAQEKGTELMATAKETAETGVTYIDSKLLDNKGAPTVKQFLADVQQEQEKQQQQNEEQDKKKNE